MAISAFRPPNSYRFDNHHNTFSAFHKNGPISTPITSLELSQTQTNAAQQIESNRSVRVLDPSRAPKIAEQSKELSISTTELCGLDNPSPRSRLSMYVHVPKRVGPTSTRQESQSSMVITFSDHNLTGQSAACFAMIDYNISLSLITLSVNNAG